MDCGEGNEEGEIRGKREGSPPEKTHCDWSPPRVSTPSLLESLEVGFRFGFVFSRESGFRDYLGFFFKSLFIATSDLTKRTPSSWSVKGAIKARLTGKAYAFQAFRFIFNVSGRFRRASP